MSTEESHQRIDLIPNLRKNKMKTPAKKTSQKIDLKLLMMDPTSHRVEGRGRSTSANDQLVGGKAVLQKMKNNPDNDSKIIEEACEASPKTGQITRKKTQEFT